MTRAEFERNFYLLKEAIENNRFHMPYELTKSMMKVRFLPNGRIDLLSIDQQARLNANMNSQFSSMMKTDFANLLDKDNESSKEEGEGG